MSTIVLIGTAHSEGGACSSKELYQIIEEISPETIFCEASPEVFPKLLKATESFNTPEIKVIRKIIKEKSIEIIPIDINEDPFDKRLEAMFSLFEQKIQEYFYASSILSNETQLKGYTFLNSVDCDQINRDKSLMEKNFVHKIKNQELSILYSSWLKWNDKRENQWINLINNYIKINKSKKAVFLVGSAHRYRLIDKIQNIRERNELIFNWDFFPFE